VEEIHIEEIEETREEKAFRNWMNSMGVDPFVNHLYEDLRDGLILLQMFDKIKPGIVNWSQVNTKKPLNIYKQCENCNYAIQLGKDLRFSLVGIAGSDIQAANKTLTLALVWQMMRFFILNYLNNISKAKGGKDITEADIVHWCNDKVKGAGKGSHMDSFKDKSLADSIFILDLLWACQPNSINFSLVNGGADEEQRMLNAQYAISCARKMGCVVFLLWEDIIEVKPKMMLTFFGAVASVFM